MLKKIAYLICMLFPKSLAEALNEAESEEELDTKVLEMAGFKDGRA